MASRDNDPDEDIRPGWRDIDSGSGHGPPVPPGQFRCYLCLGLFDLGDDAGARAEAIANGFDPDGDNMAVICDECYAMVFPRRN